MLLRMELESIMYGTETPKEGTYDDLIDEVRSKCL